jgi:hypothetical protein
MVSIFLLQDIMIKRTKTIDDFEESSRFITIAHLSIKVQICQYATPILVKRDAIIISFLLLLSRPPSYEESMTLDRDCDCSC